MIPPPTPRVVAGVVFAGWLVLAAMGHLAGSRDQAVVLTGNAARASLELFPQGWAFFTRNPREPVTRIYAQKEQAFEPLDLQAGAAGTRLGFSRRTRAWSQQVGEAVAQVPPEAWQPCLEATSDCLSRRPEVTVDLPLLRPRDAWSLCGTFGIVVQDKLPWAWSRSRALDSMPSRTVRVRWRCLS